MEEGIGKMVWDGMYYLILDSTYYDIVLNIVQKWWDLSPENSMVETVIMVTHFITEICYGFAMLKTRHTNHSFKDET